MLLLFNNRYCISFDFMSLLYCVNSMEKDGKITQARIFGIQKRYENAKYYVSINNRCTRENPGLAYCLVWWRCQLWSSNWGSWGFADHTWKNKCICKCVYNLFVMCTTPNFTPVCQMCMLCHLHLLKSSGPDDFNKCRWHSMHTWQTRVVLIIRKTWRCQFEPIMG